MQQSHRLHLMVKVPEKIYNIADRGGGMSEDQLTHLLEYSSTTADEANFGGTADTNDDTDVFSRITSPPRAIRAPRPGRWLAMATGFPYRDATLNTSAENFNSCR